MCSNGDVRLMDGNRVGVGRVEMCLGGIWSAHCGFRGWNNADAQVICRQLGFNNPESKWKDLSQERGGVVLLLFFSPYIELMYNVYASGFLFGQNP